MLELTPTIKGTIRDLKQSEEFACVLETVCSNLFIVIDSLEKWNSAHIYLILNDIKEGVDQLRIISEWAINPERVDSIIALANKQINWNHVVWAAYEWRKLFNIPHVWLEISKTIQWLWLWQFLFDIYQEVNWEITREVTHSIGQLKFLIKNWFKPVSLKMDIGGWSSATIRFDDLDDNEELIMFIIKSLNHIDWVNDFRHMHMFIELVKDETIAAKISESNIDHYGYSIRLNNQPINAKFSSESMANIFTHATDSSFAESEVLNFFHTLGLEVVVERA